MKFNYFVSVRFFKTKNAEIGFMNCSISYNKKIKSIKDIRAIESKLEKIYNCTTVTILNYKLF